MRPSHLTHLAIPGQNTRRAPAPSHKIERALSRVNLLSRELGRRNLLACTRPDPILAQWYAPHGQLSTMIDDLSAWRLGSSAARTITWQWGALRYYADDWYDDGWHPCSTYFGLAEDWCNLLDDALERSSC